MYEPTHASFFSGVGGLDLGLERAGWRTVSFSEIDPYASAVLAERWPGVPNLGDIVEIARASSGVRAPSEEGADGFESRARASSMGLQSSSAGSGLHRASPEPRRQDGTQRSGDDWHTATLWSGGFPCQDLSVAGKRAGFGIQQHGGEPEHGLRAAESVAEGGQRAGDSFSTSGAGRGVAAGGTRSGLAFAFLDLVERHRPPAILLENVPGLLSSHRGRDFGTLLDRLAQLGYGWAYRILDARHFGVPQRRRRVLIVALDTQRGLGAERAAAVLSVGSRCGRHPATGHQTGEGAADPAPDRADAAIYNATAAFGEWEADDEAGTLSRRDYKSSNHLLASPPPDPGGVRAPDGLAGRVDDRPLAYRKSARPTEADGIESWVDDGLANTLNAFDTGDIRSTHIALGEGPADDPLLPLGLDSHRYRCCGNGVVSSVAEWVGLRLLGAL